METNPRGTWRGQESQTQMCAHVQFPGKQTFETLRAAGRGFLRSGLNNNMFGVVGKELKKERLNKGKCETVSWLQGKLQLSPPEALDLEWTFRDVPNEGKGAGLCYPGLNQTSTWMRVYNLGRGSFSWLREMSRGR